MSKCRIYGLAIEIIIGCLKIQKCIPNCILYPIHVCLDCVVTVVVWWTHSLPFFLLPHKLSQSQFSLPYTAEGGAYWLSRQPNQKQTPYPNLTKWLCARL